MTFFDQIIRIERLDYLIRSRSTGTPQELSQKLGLSTSQVFKVIKIFREKLDAPVYYSKKEQSYCYAKDVKFTWGFKNLN